MNNLSYPLVLCLAGHLFVFLSTVSSAQVVINEIMYDPDSPEPEWIELYNGGDEAVDLDGWTIQDRTSAQPVFPSIAIPSKSFLVLCRDTAALLSVRSVPSPLVRISLPTLNNGGDDAVLRDADGRTVDSVSWSSAWGGRDGRSLERKTADAPGTTSASWGSSSDTSSATPGRRNGLAPLAHDLAISAVRFIPDTRIVRAVVENKGTEAALYAIALLFYDENNDGASQIGETQSTEELWNIGPGDSVVLLLPWRRAQTVGGESAILEIEYSGEERPDDNLHVFIVRSRFADTGLLINEFVYDPVAPEPEWIELHNAGELPVDLAGWTIHDVGSSRPMIDSGLILPGEFVVLVADTAALRAVRDIPSAVIPVALPALNNGGDEIILRNRDGLPSDSIRYSRAWGGANGASVERRGPDFPGNDSASWGTSLDPSGGTPGLPNSLLPPLVNLALISATFNADSLAVRAVMVNTGKKGIAGGIVHLYADENADAFPEQGELLGNVDVSRIDPGDSLSVMLAWNRPLLLEGESGIMVISVPGDERPRDDTAWFSVRRSTVDTGLVINELMYDPGDPEPEWIEVYNRGEEPVDISGWRVEDATGRSPELPSHILWPDDYVVLTSDSTELLGVRLVMSAIVQSGLPSLNNGGDRVLLRNASGSVVDSFRYAPVWGGQDGISLERKTPYSSSVASSSWLSSLAQSGGTPGARNSWEPVLYDLALDSARFDIRDTLVKAVVVNRGENTSDTSFLALYHDADTDGDGQPDELLVRRSLPPIPVQGSVSVTLPWGRPLLYNGEYGVLAIESTADQRPDDNHAAFRVVIPPVDTGIIVNEFMYAPNSPEPEWLELYNRSGGPVNLGGWQLRDKSTSSALFPDLVLVPGQYAVIVGDSLELRSVRSVPANVLQVLLPGLNNAGDQILLVNSSGRTVDSVPYRSAWGGRDGVSLERKSPELPGDDPNSWVSSRDTSGGTPGRENSAARPRSNILVGDIRFDARSSTVQAIVENDGETTPDSIVVLLYHDADGDGIPSNQERIHTEEWPGVQPSDSLLVRLDWPRELTLEGEDGLLVATFPNDENPNDNQGRFKAQLPLGDADVIINEVMFAPQAPEPEWVEHFNI